VGPGTTETPDGQGGTPAAPRRVTRRRVLVAGAAATVGVAAGGWAAVENVPSVRRRLHAAGLLDGPNRAVPEVGDIPAVDYGTLAGTDGRRYRWGRWAPAGGGPELCVVCLHPKGGDAAFPFRALGVHRFVAAAGLPWAVASLDGADAYWHRRAGGTDPLAALTDGLLPALAPAGGPFAVLGWSMGGYGALLLAERPPAGVVAAVAASPAVWTSFGAAASGAFDDASDFRAHDVLAGAAALRSGPALRVDCGEDDVFAGTSRRLLAAVPGAAGGIHPGFHDEGTWRSFLPAQIRWIGSAR
jgi:pimeloyl-ACP methyl ester carboxylesterase